tara:strand:- start:4886 stop:5152 length:267 start_codon:yes stop_codon:yes gene_type:complete
MENFISVIFDSNEEIDDIVIEEVATSAGGALLESETNYSLFETEENKSVLRVQTHVNLTNEEADMVAEDVANKLFDLGYEQFDIEVSV